MAHPTLHVAFSLCRELGGMTVFEMLDRMSATEINHWAAFFKLENEEIEKRRERQKNKNAVRRR